MSFKRATPDNQVLSMSIFVIIESDINGQLKQTVRQIKEYGETRFVRDLEELVNLELITVNSAYQLLIKYLKYK